MTESQAQPIPPEAERITYSFSPGLPELLERADATLVVTTYQAGRLLFIRARDGRLNLLMRQFEKPMGVAMREGALALGTRRQIWRLDAWSSTDDGSTRFVPRRSWVTGDVAVHELAWTGNGPAKDDQNLCFVATRFSCLARLDETHSFQPVWRPPFITALRPEDRCHLNGLAVRHGELSAVTVLGQTDEPHGWRAHKATGGAVIDVPTGETIAHGLAMPHSPRWHNESLLVLDSGRGELQRIDRDTGQRDTVARCPGFTRGLAIHGDLAFVGLSKIREKREFGGLPIEHIRDQLECAVHVIDLRSGHAVGQIRFDTGAHELFDVQILPGYPWPGVLGFSKDEIDHTFRLPPSS
ncbi:MAG: TIGR03032 family protein [Planctomycetota bacterium]